MSLALLGACTGEGTTTSGASDTADSTTGGAATDASGGGAPGTASGGAPGTASGGMPDATSGGAPDATTTMTPDDEATTSATTAAPPGTTGTGETTDGAVSYCHGFSVEAAEPFLELHVLGGETMIDGVTWPIECGGQVSWMFGLYPALGGWDPGSDMVTLTIEVDVDGFNDDPDGHFFSGELGYYIGCEVMPGGVLGVVPVVPPDTLEEKDLKHLDGEEAKVRVSVPANGEILMAEAEVTLQAPWELVKQGCDLDP